VFLTAIQDVSGSVPLCDVSRVIDLALKGINDSVLTKLSGIEMERVSFPVEVGYDSQSEARLCRAQAGHSRGEEIISYSVRWHDEDNQIMYVQILE
jgi:hypothetical protein